MPRPSKPTCGPSIHKLAMMSTSMRLLEWAVSVAASSNQSIFAIPPPCSMTGTQANVQDVVTFFT
eukprot:2486584-Pyramimonas_sp.AAC.1